MIGYSYSAKHLFAFFTESLFTANATAKMISANTAKTTAAIIVTAELSTDTSDLPMIAETIIAASKKKYIKNPIMIAMMFTAPSFRDISVSLSQLKTGFLAFFNSAQFIIIELQRKQTNALSRNTQQFAADTMPKTTHIIPRIMNGLAPMKLVQKRNTLSSTSRNSMPTLIQADTLLVLWV